MALWVVSGSCRGVGKTRVCTELAAVLPRAMCVKIGHSTPKPDRPGYYFTDVPNFRAFQTNHPEAIHWVVESNRSEIRIGADIRICIGAPPRTENLRPDAEELMAGADVRILSNADARIPACACARALADADSAVCGWRDVLRRHITAPEIVSAVCAIFERQRSYLDGQRVLRHRGPLSDSTAT